MRGAHYNGQDCVKRARLKNAKVGAVDWSGKDMRGAQLQGCDLQGCLLRNTNLWYANFEQANLLEADLSGARYDAETCAKRGWLRGATVGAVDWGGKDLRGAQLQGVDLQGANLKNADLTGANLERANAQGVNMMNANLQGWKALHANLCGVNFYRADLRNAELRTDLMDGNTYFGNARVDGAVISSHGWQRAFAVGTLRADGVQLVQFDGVPAAQTESKSPEAGGTSPAAEVPESSEISIENGQTGLVVEGMNEIGLADGADNVEIEPVLQGSAQGTPPRSEVVNGTDEEDHPDVQMPTQTLDEILTDEVVSVPAGEVDGETGEMIHDVSLLGGKEVPLDINEGTSTYAATDDQEEDITSLL